MKLALISTCLLAGCESMSAYETAWQAAHIVDVAQTLNGPASDACYPEQDPVTRSIIGEHPHRDAVLAWGVGSSIAHYFIGRWIGNSDWPDGVKTFILSVDLGYKGFTVGRNHDIGIRPWGDNASCEPPPFRMPGAQPVK